MRPVISGLCIVLAAGVLGGLLTVGLPTASAQNCVRNRAVFVHQTVPYVPTYAATVAYATPVVAIEVPTALDYYYSLNSYYQSQLIADAVVGKLALLNQQKRPVAQSVSPTAPAAVKPGPVSMTPGGDEPSAQLAKVVGDSCIRCHSAAKASGGLDLSNLSAVPELERFKIAAYVLDGTMPQGGTNLPDDQAQLFFAWAKGFKTASR